VRRGIVAEYASVAALLDAGRALRARGFTRLEAFTPHPVREIDEALAARPSPLSIAAGVGAALGAAGGYALQWLLVVYLYPLWLGARPPHMPLPFTIITVEMGFLGGAIAVVAAFLVAARLLRPWDPVFEVPGFESATADGYWIAVGADDPRWDRRTLEEVLAATAPRQVHGFGGAG
jgi:hypothetical protein